MLDRTENCQILEPLGEKMSEVFITYNVTISEEELDIISEMVENEGNQLEMEGAVINGILGQILDQAKAKDQHRRYLLLGEEEFDEEKK